MVLAVPDCGHFSIKILQTMGRCRSQRQMLRFMPGRLLRLLALPMLRKTVSISALTLVCFLATTSLEHQVISETSHYVIATRKQPMLVLLSGSILLPAGLNVGRELVSGQRPFSQ